MASLANHRRAKAIEPAARPIIGNLAGRLADGVRRLWQPRGLRHKLLLLVLLPLLLLTGTVIVMAARWATDHTYRQLFARVDTDLRVAHSVFDRIGSDRQSELRSFADSSALRDAFEADDEADLSRLLDTQARLGRFDFLTLQRTDTGARLLDGTWLKPEAGGELPAYPSASRLTGGSREVFGNGIQVLEADELAQLDPSLPARVRLPLVDTPFAAPTDRQVEDRAMVIRVRQPVHDRNGRVVARLDGGVLLNRNFDFVDEIRDLVYARGSLFDGSVGTVTVFLDDVRISTNVPTSRATRALGTRVSQAVRSAVLEQGERWVDRAFVVNDWYISAYEPIVDLQGRAVGMLYAGFLESPYRVELGLGILRQALLLLGGALLAAGTALLGAKTIFKPIESIAAVARATAAGEPQRRIGPMSAGDELSELAQQFDAMLDTLEQQRARIEHDSAGLEHKVAERTLALETQNRRLQESIDLLNRTRQELATAEKLAALGELTAGVAHEINNPTAVILGNLDVVIQELGEAGEPWQVELDLIIEQVFRIRSITDRLLQYSRQATREPGRAVTCTRSLEDAHSADRAQPVCSVVARVVEESIGLVQHELESKAVRLHRPESATLPGGGECLAAIGRLEFQQVLVNLLSNAVQAIDPGGAIYIRVEVPQAGHIAVSIADDGPGIDPAHQPRVFDPFFSIGKRQGTGLGLSVSYGIVHRHGGDIELVSVPGQGACFTVTLPQALSSGPAMN